MNERPYISIPNISSICYFVATVCYIMVVICSGHIEGMFRISLICLLVT